ncbi:MAG: DUF167 domain-containing protein [Candidatus Paceibacterota bacterium]
MHIKVHVYPGASEERLVQTSEDSFDVFVREAAQDGRANKRVIECVRSFFSKNGKTTNIRIVSGTRSPHKILHIDD